MHILFIAKPARLTIPDTVALMFIVWFKRQSIHRMTAIFSCRVKSIKKLFVCVCVSVLVVLLQNCQYSVGEKKLQSNFCSHSIRQRLFSWWAYWVPETHTSTNSQCAWISTTPMSVYFYNLIQYEYVYGLKCFYWLLGYHITKATESHFGKCQHEENTQRDFIN